MLFVVTGANHATGAKTRLEIDATSRAAAEKAAVRSGVEVHHCHAASDDPVAHPHARKANPERVCEGGSCTKLIAMGALLLIGLLAWILI